MKYCTHCGKPLDDKAVFCPGCGRPVGNVPRAGTDGVTPYIIWSVVLIVFCNPVGLVLGIIALVEALSVSSAPDAATAAKKLSTVRTLCIVATCIDAAMLLLGIVGKVLSFLWWWPFHWNLHWFVS